MKTILVLQSGFVFVGTLKASLDDVARNNGSRVELSEAACIRRWGTTNGLGQLALSGPTKDTILDESGDVTAPINAVILTMDCPGWK